MWFIDLNKLKIHKNYSYQTITTTVVDNNMFQHNLKDMQLIFSTAAAELASQSTNLESVLYRIIINEDQVASEEELDNFLVLVNIATAEFFKTFVTQEGRPRERRLDVPSNLKVVKCNMSLLKRAINAKTLCDSFNFQICYKDLVYILCDEREETFNE